MTMISNRYETLDIDPEVRGDAGYFLERANAYTDEELNDFSRVDKFAPVDIEVPEEFMEREDIYWNPLLIKESGGNPELFRQIVAREYLAEQKRVEYNLVGNSVSDPQSERLWQQANFVEAMKSIMGIEMPVQSLAKMESEAYEEPAKYLTAP